MGMTPLHDAREGRGRKLGATRVTLFGVLGPDEHMKLMRTLRCRGAQAFYWSVHGATRDAHLSPVGVLANASSLRCSESCRPARPGWEFPQPTACRIARCGRRARAGSDFRRTPGGTNRGRGSIGTGLTWPFLPAGPARPVHSRPDRRSARAGRSVTGPDPIGPGGGSPGPRTAGWSAVAAGPGGVRRPSHRPAHCGRFAGRAGRDTYGGEPFDRGVSRRAPNFAVRRPI